ncbi:MAG: LytTR family DNA-binding domain-containing protein [Cyclobacteriaceae bacterium]
MIKTIIVEDELNARIALRQMLIEDCPQVRIVGESDNADDALNKIKQLKPDLVLLDIHLRDSNSFQILNKTDYSSFHIIFTTAYENYAIKAFRFSAVDYLLKPINRNYLKSAIDKLPVKPLKENYTQQIETLLANLNQTDKSPKKIILSTQDMINVVDLSDIVRCEANVNYTKFVISGQPNLLISRTLKEFEEELGPCGFMRIHKSHLINLHYVKGYDKREGGSVVLSDGTHVPLSLRKREQFMELLKTLVV